MIMMNRRLCGLKQCLCKVFYLKLQNRSFLDGRLQVLYFLYFPIVCGNSVHVSDLLITQQQTENSLDDDYSFKTQPLTSSAHAN